MTKEEKIQFIESLYDRIGRAGSDRARQKIIESLVDFLNTTHQDHSARTKALNMSSGIRAIRNDAMEGILSYSTMSRNRNKWNLDLLNLLDVIKTDIQVGHTEPAPPIVTTPPPTVTPTPQPVVPPAPTTNKPILFIATNPINLQLLRESGEFNKIEQAKLGATNGKLFQSIKKGEVQKKDLSKFVRQNNPYILHFATHADKEKGIILQDKNRRPVYVDSDDLIHILQQQINRGKAIKCLVLNNCNTEGLAEACKDYVDYIIYLNDFIDDEEALRFTEGFYTYLFDEENFSAAFAEGVYFIQKDENKLRYQMLTKAE